MHDPQEWITRLNMSGKPLSKGQKRIAEYISCHYEKAVSMTAVMLGRQCGVSESTVVRFAMALGYEGYPEMQEKLRSMVRQRLTAEQRVGMMEETDRREVVSTVLKNVLTADVPEMPFWRVLLGIFTKEQKMRALESLDKVGILSKAYTRCDQLSGGQQQRVALARTLNQNPSIILADEPVASLDPITAKQVMSDFVRINKEYNISILLNIHHVDLALKYCDRVVGVRAGELVFDGPASTITQEQLDEVYNGTAVPTMDKE